MAPAPGIHPTDLLLAALSLGGLLLVARRLDGADAPSRALRAVLLLAAAFTAARAGHWVTGLAALRAATLATAALVPLGALVLAEVLVRRHAPLWVKWAVAGGAAGFALAALAGVPARAPAFPLALAAFQLGALALVAGLVVGRDRKDLTPGENGLIDRLSLALPFVLPFLASDHAVAGASPLRLSGVAVLVTCWIGLGLRRPGVRPRETLGAVAATLGLGALAVAALAAQLPLALPDALRAWGAVAAVMVGAMLLREDAELRALARRRAVLPAEAEPTGAEPYLADLRTKGVLDDVAVAEGPALDDFDRGALAALLAARPSVALDDLPPPGRAGGPEGQLRALLERHGATQAHLLGLAPLRVALVRATGPLGGSPDPDLQMAFALARALGARRGAPEAAAAAEGRAA